MKFLNLYQYLAPLILFPTSYALWYRQMAGSHAAVLFMLSMPVLFAYVIPGLGTNWLGLWEFNTRLRLGRFRPHHGFVFGTATSLFGLFVVAAAPFDFSPAELVRAGLVLGSVLAFWNWLYDIYAIKVGFLRVYNRPYAAGLPAEAIAADYAPAIFGVFGLCYGVAIRLGQQLLVVQPGQGSTFWGLLLGCNLLCLLLPVLAFILCSYLRYGEAGLNAYPGKGSLVCD